MPHPQVYLTNSVYHHCTAFSSLDYWIPLRAEFHQLAAHSTNFSPCGTCGSGGSNKAMNPSKHRNLACMACVKLEEYEWQEKILYVFRILSQNCLETAYTTSIHRVLQQNFHFKATLRSSLPHLCERTCHPANLHHVGVRSDWCGWAERFFFPSCQRCHSSASYSCKRWSIGRSCPLLRF